MAKPRNRLMMKQLGELSLVDNPANQHASAVIAKRAEPEPAGFRARLTALGKRLLDAAIPPAEVQAELAAIGKDAESYEEALNRPKVWEKFSAIEEVIRTVLDDQDMTVDAKREKIDAALSSFRDDILSITKADDAGAKKCPECGTELQKGACPQGHGVKKTEDPNPHAGGAGASNTDPIPGAEMRTAQNFTDVAKANEHIAVLTTALNEAEGKLDTEIAKSDPLAIITKGMTPAAAEAFRKMHERNAALEAERLNERYVTKADKILKGVVSDDAEGRGAAIALVKTLAGVATDAERATAETFVTKLAAQHAEVVKELDGLEVGGNGASTSGAAERGERLEKAARELMKADPKLTLPQAVSKALEADPELYEEPASEPAE